MKPEPGKIYRRSIYGVLITAAAATALILVALIAAPPAHAKLSLNVVSGWHVLPVGPKLHAGPIYYSPGDGKPGSRATRSADDVDELGMWLASEARKDRERARKLRCDRLHAEYVGRHGLTTPRPLKGFHGCQKWALDAAYWQKRRYGVQVNTSLNPVHRAVLQADLSAHNIILWRH